MSSFKKDHPYLDRKKLNLLYFYHMFFYGVYTWYAYNNPSDSWNYYQVVSLHPGGWFDLFGPDTAIIHFLSYPFYTIGFNYDMLMATFAWLGYLGFMYAYLFFREKITIKVRVFKGIDLFTLILFFPNMHFWTASLGKGAPIFLGLMMYLYAVVKPQKRVFLLILSTLMIFYIRPHMFMFVAVGTVLGYMSGKEKIALWKKSLIYIILITALVLAQDQILAVLNLQNSENIIEDFQEVSAARADELNDAGSGVNMASYPLPLKLFTFWFRPLFLDAPNLLGLIVSFENLIYLLLFIKILKKDFIKFLVKSPSYVKMSFVIFLSTSFAMTFIMSNLGLIMRQKSMVMYFIFFVIYYYLAHKNYLKLVRKRKMRARLKSNEKSELVLK